MQQWLTNFAMKVQRFMMGRYGGDQLNMALLILSVVVSLVSGFVPMGWICTIVSTILIALVFFRMLSRNTSRRFKENYVFLKVWNPVKNWFRWVYLSVRYMKKNRYFLCPKCGRIACIPKKVGRVTITCKGCKHKYDKKA